MSIYGSNIFTKNESCIITIPLVESIEEPVFDNDIIKEGANKDRVDYMRIINNSITKTLFNLGLKAICKDHKIVMGTYKYTHDKKDNFDVDIVLEALASSALGSIINALPIPYVVKVILLSIINTKQKEVTLDAVKIINASMDELSKNLKKDMPDGVEVKLGGAKRNQKYTNAIILNVQVIDKKN